MQGEAGWGGLMGGERKRSVQNKRHGTGNFESLHLNEKKIQERKGRTVTQEEHRRKIESTLVLHTVTGRARSLFRTPGVNLYSQGGL